MSQTANLDNKMTNNKTEQDYPVEAVDFKKPNIYNLQPLKVAEPNSNQLKSLKVVKLISVKFGFKNFVSNSEPRQQDDKQQNRTRLSSRGNAFQET